MSESRKMPSGWAWATIPEMIPKEGVFVDGDWIESKDQDPNGEVRLIQLADIGDGNFRNKSSRFLALERANALNCTFLRHNDILVARMPDPIGRACLFPLRNENSFVTAVDVAIIRLGEKSVIPKYLMYSINNLYIRREIESLQSGTTRKRISRSNLAIIKFPLPPLPEQHRIVDKIEELFNSLDKGIESLKTAQQQLKVYRQAVLKWAFEGKLTNKNVVDGELPEGWTWVKIDDISNVVRGGSPRPAGDPKYYDGNIPFLKVADITKDNCVFLNTFNYTIKEAGLHKTRKISPNTLLLSNSGATLGVPKICMIDATMNDGIAAFLDLDKRSNLYLYYFWLSKTHELRNINMGAAQPNLNTDIIKNYIVPYCSFETQHGIVAEIESRLSVCDKIEESIEHSLNQSEALRQSILKKAFEGKLVPQDPSDEPASVLLERIRAERALRQVQGQSKPVKKISTKKEKA